MEEEWAARNKSRMVTDSSSSFGAKDGGGRHYAKKDKTRARGGDMHDSGAKLTSMVTPRRKGKCRKCGIYGHWGKECKKAPKEERQEAAHVVCAEVEQPALLVAQVCNLVRTANTASQRVFLN
jgi:hypothetical protein